MLAIYKREFRAFMRNMTGPIFIFFLLLFTGACVTIYNLIVGYSSLQFAIEWTGLAFIVVIPIITMRSLSEDKANRTNQLLFSLPMKMSDIVLGKFFAISTVFAIPVLIMLLYPVILSAYGYMYYVASYSAILALFLLGLALISLCMFISSFTESQVISAIISFGIIILLLVLSLIISLIPSSALVSFVCLVLLSVVAAIIIWRLTANVNAGMITAALLIVPQCIIYFVNSSLYTGLFPKVLGWISLYERFYSLLSGAFDLRSVVYLLSVTVFFQFLSVQSLDKRRWS